MYSPFGIQKYLSSYKVYIKEKILRLVKLEHCKKKKNNAY